MPFENCQVQYAGTKTIIIASVLNVMTYNRYHQARAKKTLHCICDLIAET